MQNVFKHGQALLALVLAPTLIYGQTQGGTLDASFGTGGKVTTDMAGSVAVQADGKLVVAGSAPTLDSSNFALERYNSNGALDVSFGTGGKVTTDFGGRFQFWTSVALQVDGKIVAAGGGSFTNQIGEFALARYNSDGTLDTSFGSGGKVHTNIGGGSAQARSLAVQPDGKIVVVGYANVGGGENFELVRYNSNGTLDASFGTGGEVTTTFGVPQQGFSFALAYSLALQQDGKIVLAGEATINGDRDFALARYNSNGTLDPTFGTGGQVTTTFGQNDVAFSVAVQPDGKIVTAGFGLFKFALARYNSNGTLDPSFGTGGQVTTAIGGLNDGAEHVALQGDGKIVVSGRGFINGDFHSVLARYNSNGTFDASFGTGGTVTAIFGGDSDGISIALQPDGKIVVSGAATINWNTTRALARFNSGTGTAPAASVTPASLSFFQTLATTSTAKTVTLQNTGSGPMQVSSVTTAAPFNQTNNCSASIAPGSSCTIQVSFTPTVLGSVSGTLTINDNAGTQTAALTGTGTAAVSFSSTALSFGTVAVGDTTAAKTVTVTNRQTVALSFSSIAASAGFTIAGNNCLVGLAAGAACTVGVRFTPSAIGNVNGTLTFTDSAVNSPQTVSLTGAGSAPVTLSSTGLSLGTVVVGSTSSARTVTLTNHQIASLGFSSIVTTAGFAIASNTCGSSLAGGASCTVGVTFTPRATGAATGTLSFTDTATNSPQTVSLSGTGIAPVTLSGTGLSFGIVAVGNTSPAKTVTLTNHETTTLTFSGINASAGFTIASNTCGASVAAGGNCTVGVTFSPTRTGAAAGTLTFNDNAGNSPQTVTLTGTGQ